MENDIFKASGVDFWTKARMRKANTYKSLGEKIKKMKRDIVSPIKTIFKSSHNNYGSPKIKIESAKKGMIVHVILVGES